MSGTDSLATTDTNAGDGRQGAPMEADAGRGGSPAGADVTQADESAARAPGGREADGSGEAGGARSGAKSGERPGEERGGPEAYAFKAPDGQALDETLVSAFTPLARDLSLSQDEAQKFVDLYATKVLPRIETAMAEQWARTQAGWAEAAKADREFGGDAFDANVAVANQAVARFGGPELVKALKETGAGNHPDIIRAFYRIGKAISEDTIPTGATGGGQRDAADILFPTMARNPR